MTTAIRIRILIIGLIVAVTSTLAAGLLGYATARADAPPVVVHDHRGELAAPATDSKALPPPAIADPLANPTAAFDQVEAAKKLGWPVLVLVVIIIATRLLSRFQSLAFLHTGKVSLAIAAVGALATAAYDALANGGPWMAAVLAGVIAGFAAWDAAAKPKAGAA